MAFTRDEISEYEKQPAKVVPDTETPFKPAASGEQMPPADDQPPPDDDAAPSGTDDETPPDESGDGTSGANDAAGDSPNPDDAGPDGESDQPTVDADGNTVDPPPKKGSARERIQELVEERDSFRSYGEYAQAQLNIKDQQLAELNQKLQGVKPAAPGVKEDDGVDDPVPTLEDPDIQYDPDKLTRKLVAWREKVKEKARKAAASAPAARPDPQVENQKIVNTFNERVNKFAETHKDFEAVVKLLPQLAQPAAQAVVFDESGPEILYWLGKHKAEAIRIVQLPPQLQVLEIGTIRGTLRKSAPAQGKTKVIPSTDQTPPPDASKTQAKPKSTSNAPPPPSAVRGGSRHDQVPITDPGLSMDEFVRRTRADKLAKSEARKKLRGSR